MRIVAEGVSKGSDGIPLPVRTESFETGRVTIAEAEVGDHPTVLALVLSGRMVPDTGSVTITGGSPSADGRGSLDGSAGAALLRERIALVDAPDVSEPAADLLLRDVVKEELMYAGRSTSRATVEQTIADAGAAEFARVRVADVPAALRVRMLADLAAFRPGVRGLVLTQPDRHGGDPRDWLHVALDLAERDFAVLVVTGYAAAEIVRPLLPAPTAASAAPSTPTQPDHDPEGESA